MVDPGPRARTAFAVFWIGLQGTLILTASRRPDHIFGFRMFPEASTIEVHLSRETATAILPMPRGEWSAPDAAGRTRRFAWRDRVRDPILAATDVRAFASYGADVQLTRLQHAPDDVADHVDDDETRRFRAEVLVSKNGGEPSMVTLVSHLRRTRR